MTIKEVAERTGISAATIKKNVDELLVVLPVRKRMRVMEYMVHCKGIRKKKEVLKVLELDKLPANPDASDALEFLGVTSDDMWEASKEYSRRINVAKSEGRDVHAEFGLKRELIIEVAKEVDARNLTWIKEHFDKRRPMGILKQLHKAPKDKAAWTLKLLRRHDFKRVELCVWVAADVFLQAWVQKFGQEALVKVMSMMPKE